MHTFLLLLVLSSELQKVFFTAHYFVSFTRRLRLRIIDEPCAIVDALFGFSVSGPCVRSSSLRFKLTCDRLFFFFLSFLLSSFRPCITTTVAFDSSAPDFSFRAPIRLLMPAWFLSVNLFYHSIPTFFYSICSIDRFSDLPIYAFVFVTTLISFSNFLSIRPCRPDRRKMI